MDLLSLAQLTQKACNFDEMNSIDYINLFVHALLLLLLTTSNDEISNLSYLLSSGDAHSNNTEFP